MQKDIVVFLTSRSSPKKCETVLKMLYGQCSSKNNFDIVVIVDDDEILLYSELISKYPEVIWEHPEHMGPHSPKIYEIIFKTVEHNDYYFNWWVSDDWTGLSENWDLDILKLKDIFADGLFTLFQSDPMGRNLNALSSQFRYALHWRDGYRKPLVSDPPDLIYHYHDLMPVMTKKWRLALREFYTDDFKGPDYIFLNASLAHVLSTNYGYSRSVQCRLSYGALVDNFSTSKVLFAGMSRDELFWKYAREEQFSMIKPVAKKVATSIWQYYRDVMDKPRGIGKYAI